MGYHCFHPGCNYDMCEDCMHEYGGPPPGAPGKREKEPVDTGPGEADPLFAELKVGELIGSSFFKDVYEGTFQDREVAVVRTCAGVRMAIDAGSMMQLGQHPYLLDFLGAATAPDGADYLIFEMSSEGPLELILEDEGPDLTYDLKTWIAQAVASGLETIHASGLVHNHLSSRNVFVESLEEPVVVKLSDYGLTPHPLHVPDDPNDPVRASISARGKHAHVFDAPEVLAGAAPTPASDIWAFGVFLWELWSNGSAPYAGIPGVDHTDPNSVLSFLNAGGRLPAPDVDGFTALYDYMLRCWSPDPAQRPLVSDLAPRLTILADAYYAPPPEGDDNQGVAGAGGDVGINEIEDDPAIDASAPPPLAAAAAAPIPSPHAYVGRPKPSFRMCAL